MSENETKQPSAGEVLLRIAEWLEAKHHVEGDPLVFTHWEEHRNRCRPLQIAIEALDPAHLRALAAQSQPAPDRSDRFASEMLHFESIKEAEQAHDAHRRAMRDERRTRFERRIREALERNWQAWPLATPHGVAGYLADALCPPTEAGEAP